VRPALCEMPEHTGLPGNDPHERGDAHLGGAGRPLARLQKGRRRRSAGPLPS
jgi:hypothetical protein